jgi:ribosomal protein S25
MKTAFSLIVLVLFMCEAVRCEPQVIHTPEGIYAHPADNTPQCFTTSKLAQRLCIGNQYAAENIKALLEEGVTHVVSAIGRYSGVVEDLFVYHFEEFDDSVSLSHEELTSVLYRTTAFIEQTFHASPNATVFVHCAAGVSRSATIVLAYLMYTNECRSVEEALAALRVVRSVVQPNAFFMHTLGLLYALRIYADTGARVHSSDSVETRQIVPVKDDHTADETTRMARAEQKFRDWRVGPKTVGAAEEETRVDHQATKKETATNTSNNAWLLGFDMNRFIPPGVLIPVLCVLLWGLFEWSRSRAWHKAEALRKARKIEALRQMIRDEIKKDVPSARARSLHPISAHPPLDVN